MKLINFKIDTNVVTTVLKITCMIKGGWTQSELEESSTFSFLFRDILGLLALIFYLPPPSIVSATFFLFAVVVNFELFYDSESLSLTATNFFFTFFETFLQSLSLESDLKPSIGIRWCKTRPRNSHENQNHSNPKTKRRELIQFQWEIYLRNCFERKIFQFRETSNALCE